MINSEEYGVRRVRSVLALTVRSVGEEYEEDGVGMECEEDDMGMERVKRMGWGLTEGRVSMAEYGISSLHTTHQ